MSQQDLGITFGVSPLDRTQLPYPVEGLRRALGADPKGESGVSPWRICPLSLWACI